MKKGALGARTLVEIIAFTVFLLFVGLPLYGLLLETVFGVDRPSRQALGYLEVEINTADSTLRPVPLHISNGFLISGYTEEEVKPKKCKKENQACICLCKSHPGCIETLGGVDICKNLDELTDLASGGIILRSSGKGISNCFVIRKTPSKVKVSCT